MSKRGSHKYTYQEVYEESLKYFNDDDLAAKVFVDKYALKDGDNNYFEKTPKDMHWRLATEIARMDKKKFKDPLSKEDIFNYLDKYKYIIPQGSILYGLGNKFQYVSLSNCFVTSSPLDSYSSIIQTDENLVNISKRRGGVGIDLSNLRPEKIRVKNAAHTTSGLVTWMERYSNSIREVGQNNRRGALMLTLNVHHPQIMDFINAKADLKKVTGANISVRLTDKFLTAVDKGNSYELRWPINNPQIKSQTSAQEVWDQIINRSWNTAEPGVLFWDNILKNSPADCYEEFQTAGTNPCIPNWELLLTPDGLKSLSQLNAGDKIWSKDGWTTITQKRSTGINKVYKYITTAGNINCTENHNLISNNNKVKAKDALNVDIITGPYKVSDNINPTLVMDGLVLGDGSVHKSSNNLVYLHIGEDDFDYFNSEISHLLKKERSKLAKTSWEIHTNITYKELPHTYLRVIPDRYFNLNRNNTCSFLRGIYSANGSVCGNRITLKCSSINVIQGVQKLLSSIGIKSYFTTNKKKTVKFTNGDYECKESYDLNISVDRKKFVESIGFIQTYKLDKISLDQSNGYSKQNYDIVKNTFISEEETFSISVDNDSRTFWLGGLNVANCAELPLSAFDSCRLLCLNLMSYVDNAFKYNSTFNYKKFYDHAQIAQRIMDNIVDLELECIDKIINKIKSDPEPQKVKRNELDMWNQIKKSCKNGRRTGVGITGLGDTFAALNVKYGSNKSIKVGEKIYKTLKFGCYRSSVDMAKEISPFTCWDHKKEAKNAFLCRIKDEKLDLGDITICGKVLYNDMKKYGRRNIALLTIAPTGTISTQTQTTSGIEPVFMLKYTRRKKINHGDDTSRVDYHDDLGDKWQEFDVLHHNFHTWMRITEKTEISDSPYHESCAEEINWKNRVKLQGAMQKHCDHSISATINLPEDVSVDEVKNIYTTAWKEGLKGITIYRKNSRAGVLIETKEDISTEERPKELECEVYHVTVKGKPYFVLFGILNNNPYEIFAGKSGNFIDKSVQSGKIVKTARPKGYKAILNDGTEICPITIACTEDEEVISRLVSILLRYNTPIHHIVDQLSKVDGDLTSFAKCISRALKKYVKDGTKAKEKCPSCSNKQNLVYSEGCLKCLNCSWSKCS